MNTGKQQNIAFKGNLLEKYSKPEDAVKEGVVARTDKDYYEKYKEKMFDLHVTLLRVLNIKDVSRSHKAVIKENEKFHKEGGKIVKLEEDGQLVLKNGKDVISVYPKNLDIVENGKDQKTIFGIPKFGY
jgi:hypothetical protein